MAMSLCVAITGKSAAGAADSAETIGEAEMIGGKARSLLRLARAGYRVPAAFAVTGDLFRRLRVGGPALPEALRGAADLAVLDRARDALLAAAWPPGFLDELDRHLNRLSPGDAGARFSVRSSFAGEDGSQHGNSALAAGVYESVVDVARPGVPAAIRRVLASGLSPGAVAYAQSRGTNARDGGETAPVAAVLIHGYVSGTASGSAAFDPAGARPVVIEAGGTEIGDAARADIERALRDLAAREGQSVEIEWVHAGGQLVLLQLRPYTAPPPARTSTWAPGAALGPGAWRWDAAHNPLPLSPAQAGLVQLVDARCRIGIRQRVAGGYLFHAADGPAPSRAIEADAVGDELAALVGRFEAWQRGRAESPTLEEALAIFVEIYDGIYGVIQPAARRAGRALDDFLRAHPGDDGGGGAELPQLYAGVPSLAEERHARAQDLQRAGSNEARDLALAVYLARFGDEAPVWDVAVPTYREDPARLLSLAAARSPEAPVSGGGELPWRRVAQAIAERLAPGDRATFATLVQVARSARAAGEDDDWLYARVQATVRAALVRQGERLVASGALASPGDVFWLPFDRVRALASSESPAAPAGLRALVETARSEHARALQDPPELAGSRDDATEIARATGVVHGQRASAGRAIGRAVVLRGRRELDPAAIIVAATLLPTELPLLRAAGLVVETGGVLDHVAAQARERGIPAIVGARGACAAVADGDWVLLDADAGCLIRLG